MFDVFYIGKKPNAVAHEREVSSIEEAQELSRTRFFWIVNYLCDYTGWDFLWEPVPWEAGQRHAFASQWQKDSETYLCPRWGYEETNYHCELKITRLPTREPWEVPEGIEDFDYSWHPDPTEPPYDYQFGTQWQKTGGPRYRLPGASATKYVSQVRVKNIAISKEVYLIDHGNTEIEQVKAQLESKGLTVKKVARFISSYKGTLQRVLGRETNNYVWVCSSVCDYSNFDFSWHPEEWQGTMLHVFASNEEKFGDTFLINIPTFNERIQTTEILEWYDTIHFVDNINVPRWPLRTVHYDSNSLVDPVMQHTFTDPLVLFTDDDIPNTPTISLWREKTRTITPLNKGNSIVIVPRDAKTAIKAELYDYAYLDTTYRALNNNKPLDVVFISNGEEIAEKNWLHLQRVMQDKPNRLVRSDGVNGRVAAYQAALNASETPWAFCVFAKLTVDENFDWSWQPDHLQKNKHYIFHARNPINGLEYGHMAMIAYHKDLVLANDGSKGLDFTLDQEHEVVPVLSGVANYADDIWTAWRSAFREALKLKNDQTSFDNQYRLKEWTTKGEGEIGVWSVKGACDAVEYWESVAGDFAKLKLSYEWTWLKEYFVSKYGFEPDQQ